MLKYSKITVWFVIVLTVTILTICLALQWQIKEPVLKHSTLKDALVKCKNPEANFVLSSNQRIGIMKGKSWAHCYFRIF